MANKKVTPGGLGDAIAHELSTYNTGVTKKINLASKEAAQELVKLTAASAPVRTGGFASRIACKKVETRHGCETWAWYVKPPDHRIAHLLVHGHAKRNGGRVSGNPFLHRAWETVRRKYEQAVKEALR